jgi:hypothetical protein
MGRLLSKIAFSNARILTLIDIRWVVGLRCGVATYLRCLSEWEENVRIHCTISEGRRKSLGVRSPALSNVNLTCRSGEVGESGTVKLAVALASRVVSEVRRPERIVPNVNLTCRSEEAGESGTVKLAVALASRVVSEVRHSERIVPNV